MILYKRTIPKQHKDDTILYILVDGNYRTAEGNDVSAITHHSPPMWEDIGYVDKHKAQLVKIAELVSFKDQIKANYPELLL